MERDVMRRRSVLIAILGLLHLVTAHPGLATYSRFRYFACARFQERFWLARTSKSRPTATGNLLRYCVSRLPPTARKVVSDLASAAHGFRASARALSYEKCDVARRRAHSVSVPQMMEPRSVGLCSSHGANSTATSRCATLLSIFLMLPFSRTGRYSTDADQCAASSGW
jgi:hypothetical protein